MPIFNYNKDNECVDNYIRFGVSKEDKELITPPYKSWAEAVRASIRLWKIIRTILTLNIKEDISIHIIKDYVLSILLDIKVSILNKCPLCDYSNHIDTYCEGCPLDRSKSDGYLIYKGIRDAIDQGDMHKAIHKTTLLIQHLEKSHYLKGEGREKEEQEARKKEQVRKDQEQFGQYKITHSPSLEELKAWHTAIIIWDKMVDYSIHELSSFLWGINFDGRRGSLGNDTFISELKEKAITELNSEGHSISFNMRHNCPLCEHYKSGSNCPFRDTISEEALSWLICGIACINLPDYKTLANGPKVDMDSNSVSISDWEEYRQAIVSFRDRLKYIYNQLKKKVKHG